MHAHWPHTRARLDRRRMLFGTAGVVAGGVLAASHAQLAFADNGHGSGAVVPPPKPIPCGLQIPGGPFIHVFIAWADERDPAVFRVAAHGSLGPLVEP
jgi:hypothetical protein